ncbi:glutaminase A [Halalkalibacter krulwichiae]|uniref:Glutaminase n=1 Tax=Halalkalibacter krulwichiae TaxID=199441 RepID=A0A1X9MCJ0_9BACI|nr:glutaminase A [Halalkalibacter krulwichiae]ARK31147.1 Glutaminase 2 [Halalkalibacter krulwichiae]
MVCRYGDDLKLMIEEVRQYTKEGKVADYIPAISLANKSDVAVAIYDGNDTCFSEGNSNQLFTLQSISKVLTLALALMDHGEEIVFSKVGMEPTGDPFNSIAKLETQVPSKPLNPMINAGALAVSSLIKGSSNDEKLDRLLSFVRELSGNPSISFNKDVAKSEYDTADLNRALLYFMKQHGVISDDIEELLDFYTKQCAIEVNCEDLAKIGYALAHQGEHPDKNYSIVPTEIARLVKTFMVTCGMYNASGEFAIRVGIPAKSGVSGGIVGAVPGSIGIGIYGPALDEKGNSIAGMKLLQLLSAKYRLSIF